MVIELAMGDQDVALVIRHTEKLNDEDVNQLQQFALQKGWQLYLQLVGSASLARIDGQSSDMRLHYLFGRV